MASPSPPPQELLSRLRGALHRFGRERLELEFRLGHRDAKNGFRAGVAQEGWQRLKRTLDESAGWTRTHAVTVEQITGSGSKLITRHDDAAAAADDRQRWVHKRRLFDEDTDVRGSPWCVRGSLSLEEPEPASPAAAAANGPFRYERRKERWSYRHRCWCVDMTRAVGNLPANLDDDRETYEVELELADTDELLVRPLDNLVDWGARVARDLCAMCSSDCVTKK